MRTDLDEKEMSKEEQEAREEERLYFEDLNRFCKETGCARPIPILPRLPCESDENRAVRSMDVDYMLTRKPGECLEWDEGEKEEMTAGIEGVLFDLGFAVERKDHEDGHVSFAFEIVEDDGEIKQ